jgi:hypothetical protein
LGQPVRALSKAVKSAPVILLGFLLGTAAMAVATILMGSYSLWSQEAAGWAQAIGTIGAIFGAAWIAR